MSFPLAPAGLSGSAANAQNNVIEAVNARPSNSWNGVDLYREYCAVCHGTDGKGGGPAADALKQTPTDLTLIARRGGGKFSELDVDGVTSLQAES